MPSIRNQYKAFLDSDQGVSLYRRFKRQLYGNADSLAGHIGLLLEELPVLSRPEVHVCDIGGGDGDRIQRIIRQLYDRRGGRFNLDIVEQSRVYSARFNPKPLADFCSARMHCCSFEKAVLGKASYDIVFLIHSIFAFKNKGIAKKILALRRPGGTIVVVSNAVDGFLGGLKRLVDSGYSDKRFEIDDLKRTLRKLGVRYKQNSFFTEWAIDRRNIGKDMGIILKWISLGKYDSFSVTKRRRIEAYTSRCGKAIGSAILFREKEVVLTI